MKRFLIAAFLLLALGAGGAAYASFCGLAVITDNSFKIVSTGGQLKAFSMQTDVNCTGTDGPYSAACPDTIQYNLPDADTQISKIAAIGANAITIGVKWNWTAGTDNWTVASVTETRAGMRRVTHDVCATGKDLWIKQNGNYTGGNRTTAFPTNKTQWQTSLQALFTAFLDDIEATAGCHVWGVILTSEMDALVNGMETQFGTITAALHARYPNLRIVCNMPEWSNGQGGGFQGGSPGYFGATAGFDAICLDTYAPVATNGSPNPCPGAPTQQQVIARLSTIGSGCGGSGNFFGANGPPIGVAGTSVLNEMFNKSSTYGKPTLVFEDGYAAIDGTSVCPGCGNSGNAQVATASGLAEQANDWCGNIQAYFNPAFAWNGTRGHGGTSFWVWAPYNDITASGFFGGATNNYEVNQKFTVMNCFKAFLGGTYDPSPASYVPNS